MTPPDAGIVPGPGTPAPTPGGRRRPNAAPRAFAEPIEAWIAADVHGWWRVELTGLPSTVGPTRRRALVRIRNAWMREIRRQREEGALPPDGEYVSRVVAVDGADYFTWGPAPDSGE